MVDHMKEVFMVLIVLVLVFGFVGCESAGKAYKPVTQTYTMKTPFYKAVEPKYTIQLPPMIVVNAKADAEHVITMTDIAQCFTAKTGVQIGMGKLHTEVNTEDLKNKNTIIIPSKSKYDRFMYLVKDTNSQYDELEQCALERAHLYRGYNISRVDYDYISRQDWDSLFN